MRDTFIKALSEMAAADPSIMLLTGDLGFGVLNNFQAEHPRQFLNVGVAEQNLSGVAAGLALEGHRVFTYSIGNFPTLRCLEQIRNDICYHSLPVTIVAVGGGFSYGALGASHHATEDLAILRSLPQMTVLAPGDKWETAALTRALGSAAGPAYLRLDKSSAPDTGRSGEILAWGRARRLRDGNDLTLVATGGILGNVLAAADELAEQGCSCRVLSMPFVQPLDGLALQQAVTDTAGLVVVEEHTLAGGLGGAVAEALLDQGAVPRLFLRLGLTGGFPEVVGSQAYLRQLRGLDTPSIAGAVLARWRACGQAARAGR